MNNFKWDVAPQNLKMLCVINIHMCDLTDSSTRLVDIKNGTNITANFTYLQGWVDLNQADLKY